MRKLRTFGWEVWHWLANRWKDDYFVTLDRSAELELALDVIERSTQEPETQRTAQEALKR